MRNSHLKSTWRGCCLVALAGVLGYGAGSGAGAPAGGGGAAASPATRPAAGAPGAARADGQAVAQKPAPVAVLAIRSLADAEAVAKELGLPLPRELTPEGVEQMMPFVGKGGLAGDQPIGGVFLGAPGITRDQATVFALPVRPGAATLDSLKRFGGEPVPAQADTIFFNKPPAHFALRRTESHVLLGVSPESVGAVDPGLITRAVAGPDRRAAMTYDLKAVRQRMPQEYKAFFEQLRKNAIQGGLDREPPAPAAANPEAVRLARASRVARAAGATAATGMIAAFVDGTDRLTLAVDHGKAGLKFVATGGPAALPVAEAPGAGLPPGCFFRLDLGFPAADTFRGTYTSFAKTVAAAAYTPDGLPFPPAQARQFESILSKGTALALRGSAMTVGVEFAAGAPVLYLVHHYDEPADHVGEVRQWAADLNHLAKEVPTLAAVETGEYSLGLTKVLRLRYRDGKDTLAYVDVAQRGQEVFVAASTREFGFLERLLEAPAEAPMRAVADGWIDLGAAVDALAKTRGAGLDRVPEADIRQLSDLLRGHKLTVAASSRGDSVTVELAVPPGLVRNVPKLVAMVAGQEAEAKQTVARANLSGIATALETFEIDAGRYPTAAEGLGALTKAPPGLRTWKGPYLKPPLPKDPWGNDYAYRFPGRRNVNGYDLFSPGPDGREGGGDDVTNGETE